MYKESLGRETSETTGMLRMRDPRGRGGAEGDRSDLALLNHIMGGVEGGLC